MVEVFKTSVREHTHAQEIMSALQTHFPGSKINFDLGDCDHVLRVEGEHVSSDCIQILLRAQGFICEALD